MASKDDAEGQTQGAAFVESLRDAGVSRTFGGKVFPPNAGAERRFDRAARDAIGVTAGSDRRRLYETILSSTPDLIYVLSIDYRVLYANDSLLALWGRRLEDAVGKTLLEVASEPSQAEKLCREIDGVRASRRPLRGEIPATATHGRRVYDYIFVPVFGTMGEVEAIVGTTRDVTELREREDLLLERERDKDAFIALLAHELRNPLAPLYSGLEVIRLAEGDESAIADVRSMMLRQLEHMARLIDDLLDISRLKQNRMQLRRSRILLAEVVSSAVETARPAIEAAGHELTVLLPPKPVYLHADPTRLAQVFINLLINSARYTENGGRIWLCAERQEAEVIITVQDTGIGIPADALPHVFEMFSQADRSMERSSGGLGIGLGLAKGLVEHHEGTVTAASDGPGKGSVFTVRLPALVNSGQCPVADPSDRSSAAQTPRRRILIVDDNRDSVESMALMLKLAGNEVATAGDGFAAVEAAAQFRPNVILMDPGIPGLGGSNAMRRIREQADGMRPVIIAICGWGQEPDRAWFGADGCDGRLDRPVSLLELEELLTALSTPATDSESGAEPVIVRPTVPEIQ